MIQPRRHKSNLAGDVPWWLAVAVGVGLTVGAGITLAVDIVLHRHRCSRSRV